MNEKEDIDQSVRSRRSLREAEPLSHYRGNVAAHFFSRLSHDDHDAERDAQAPAETTVAPSDRVMEQWRSDLMSLTATDRGEDAPRLTISQAHPGGLAQLYAGRPTKLSNLVREPSAHKRSVERARAVIMRADELASRHGVATIHIAIGHAQWTDGEERLGSPVFLRPIDLHDEGSDVVITLRHGTTCAPLLERALSSHGIVLDVDALVRRASAAHGFSASTALAEIKESCGVLDGFDLREELLLGIFEHPASTLLRELDHPEQLMKSRVVRALAGDVAAHQSLTDALPEGNGADRDPWKERGVGDLTPRQQDIVEAVAAGRSLLIDAPHGADDAALVAAVIADSAANGRRTLHIAGSPSRTARAEKRLRELGVDEIAIRIDGTHANGQNLSDRILQAMEDTTAVVDQGEVSAMRAHLSDIRETLSSYTTYLHRPFRQFGVSAFHALQVLTDLTSAHPSPRTRVRFTEDVLLDIASDQGARARALLHEAADLGMFSRVSEHAAWKGIVINAADQVGDVLERVQRLAQESLPQMRMDMAAVAGETGITPASTLEGWEAQLAMFEGVRDVLDVFKPRIFERSAADMVIATASQKWRKEHGIAMPRSQRVRLVKQAQDMVRPGVHVEDLHRSLLHVQERRDVWRQHCDSDGWPTLPQRLDDLVALAASVRDDLDRLAPMFSTAHSDLAGANVAEVSRLFERLAADPEGGYELPRRVAVLKDLKDLGLDALMRDLRSRHVTHHEVDAELDLAWWASILGVMLASEPRLGGFDPAGLEQILADGRELDREQVASLTPQAIQQLRRLRQHALATSPDEQRALELAIQDGHSALSLFSQFPLTWDVLPVVLTVPTLVPLLVPQGRDIDLLIIDDVNGLPLAELVPIIARAHQVLVIADLSVDEEGAAAQLAAVLPHARLEVRPSRLNDQVALLLARYRVDHTGVPVPWTAAVAPVTALWTEGRGMPTPGSAAVESTSAEVEAVVEAVVEHAVYEPERSLAVIALNERHAERIRQHLARTALEEPGLASFFDPTALEPFVVADPQSARGVSRDRVIIATGFAKTPHGRVLHDFGVFSSAHGVHAMADVLRAVRGDLTVISSIRASEIDRSRLSAQGAQMLVDLLEIAEGQSGQGLDSWPTLEGEPDRLLIDLADRLYGMGLEVVPNVGISGGMRIPLAIGHPEVPGRLLVAVLTDDEAYVAEESLRVRDRMWPSMLMEQGWKVHTALSMAVFIDPAKETEKIVQLVLDAVDEINGVEEPVLEAPIRVEIGEDPNVERIVVDEASAASSPLPEVGAPSAGESAGGEATAEQSVDHRERADEFATGMIRLVQESSREDERRGARPAIARGLPLSAYSDDQLDELAVWIRSDGRERDEESMIEEMREALGVTRRGVQSDAVLRHVVRRTDPVGAAPVPVEVEGDEGEHPSTDTSAEAVDLSGETPEER